MEDSKAERWKGIGFLKCHLAPGPNNPGVVLLWSYVCMIVYVCLCVFLGYCLIILIMQHIQFYKYKIKV